ncbi:zinc-ribbon domain-containing protein [Dethiothermospora halolimnae]|uniref:zinc-ribbon domain-containing protein n=1 Tax=Dethiothermospora halolimnae TaxID=3114390 RepID=UPI003CCC0D48
MEELRVIHPLIWGGIATLLLIQASWIFYDASKRGENKWLWGIFGLLNVPSNLIIYLIVTRIIFKTKECPNCRKNIKLNSKYCSYCGEPVEEN